MGEFSDLAHSMLMASKSIARLGGSIVDYSDTCFLLAEAENRLDQYYKSKGLFHRILGWLFPRTYDFRRSSWIG